jgi:hypothetical protein
MKKIAFILIFCLPVLAGISQNTSDSIFVKQRLGKVFVQHDKTLPAGSLHSILSADPEGAREVDRAKANLAPMYIFSIAGGFMIGWTAGTALGGGKANWAVAAGGLGLALCSIPFQSGYNKHILKAVKIYNSNLQKIGIRRSLLEIGLSERNFGVEIKF